MVDCWCVMISCKEKHFQFIPWPMISRNVSFALSTGFSGAQIGSAKPQSKVIETPYHYCRALKLNSYCQKVALAKESHSQNSSLRSASCKYWQQRYTDPAKLHIPGHRMSRIFVNEMTGRTQTQTIDCQGIFGGTTHGDAHSILNPILNAKRVFEMLFLLHLPDLRLFQRTTSYKFEGSEMKTETFRELFQSVTHFHGDCTLSHILGRRTLLVECPFPGQMTDYCTIDTETVVSKKEKRNSPESVILENRFEMSR
jgi:hypothetical protein